MRQKSPFMQRFDELPNSLRIFPLPNAVFLPGGHLPLNIFEPRYLNMVRDAMRSDQLVGMIQPLENSPPFDLYSVGCAGRITRYEEKNDGRIELVLSGLCRFEIEEELATTRGYRMITPAWNRFKSDLAAAIAPEARTTLQFKTALQAYLQRNDIQADWQMLDALNVEDLSNSLLSYLPLDPSDKQILLEADGLAHRLTVFTAILEGDAKRKPITH